MYHAPVSKSDKEGINTVWNFGKDKTQIIFSVLRGGSKEGFGHVGPICEMYAIFEMAFFFHSIYPSLDISLEPSVGALYNYAKNNLILIGGPKRNKITNAALKVLREKKKLLWDFNERSQIFNRESHQVYQYEKSDNHYIDYALIIKHLNMFNPSQLTFIIAGCRDVGTFAAVHFFRDSKVLKKIAQKYRHGSFVILLKIDSKNSEISNDPIITLVDPPDLQIPPLPISFPSIFNEQPIIDIQSIVSNIPVRKYVLWFSLGITIFLVSLILILQGHFFLLPSLLASMAILFALPLRIWKKHKVIFGVSPAFSLFGLWMSVTVFFMSLGWLILRLVFK